MTVSNLSPTAGGALRGADVEALALSLWREVCRGAAYEETVSRLLGAVSGTLGVQAMIIVRTDEEVLGKAVVTRLGGGTQPLPVEGSVERLRALLRGGRVAEGAALELAAAGVPLVPGLEGQYLAGALDSAGVLLGILLLLSRDTAPFGVVSRTALEQLLEPFTSLLQRELAAIPLRGAAATEAGAGEAPFEEVPAAHAEGAIVGASAGLRGTMALVGCAAPADVPVLILGETGSGKEVIARAIHEHSPRADGPFIKVNCGAIPSELVDSELFGHERGSFTGAVAARRGWFERAHSGTLFLDEIGELPLAAQVRLLRVLQDGTFERVGAQKTLSVDVRILAATHRDLARMAAAGTFRRDLWYRLSVFPIHVPPLRERLEDLPALASHFAAQAGERIHGRVLGPSDDDLARLQAHPWPGNVRELAAVIERAVLLGAGRGLDVDGALRLTLPVEDRGHAPGATPPAPPLPGAAAPAGFKPLEQVMIEHIERALARAGGKIEGPGGAAALLGVNPHTLRARMRKLGVDWSRFRPRSG